MAAAALSVGIDVIGVVSGALGIYSFAADQMPSKPANAASSSSLRVHMGSGASVPNSGGTLGAIKAYSEDQILIGAGSGDGPIPYGGFQDINIDMSYGPGQQPTYIQVNAGDDGVCIAYMIQTWPDGTQRGWLGDMGRACGASWAYSNVIVGKSHKPACTWLDQNHDGVRDGSVQIHMQDFTNVTDEGYSADPAHYCAWPAMYLEPRTEATGLPDNRIWGENATAVTERGMKRAKVVRKRSKVLEDMIVGSHDEAHSAIELCGSETSHGSDFVSFAEGVFCDMGTKMVWPLCQGETKVECFEWESRTLVGKDGELTERVYGDVQTWE